MRIVLGGKYPPWAQALHKQYSMTGLRVCGALYRGPRSLRIRAVLSSTVNASEGGPPEGVLNRILRKAVRLGLLEGLDCGARARFAGAPLMRDKYWTSGNVRCVIRANQWAV